MRASEEEDAALMDSRADLAVFRERWHRARHPLRLVNLDNEQFGLGGLAARLVRLACDSWFCQQTPKLP